jgi:hypothetical protein
VPPLCDGCTAAAAEDQFIYLHGFDPAGHDLLSMHTPDAAQCAERCRQLRQQGSNPAARRTGGPGAANRPRCNGFTFIRGECYLKVRSTIHPRRSWQCPHKRCDDRSADFGEAATLAESGHPFYGDSELDSIPNSSAFVSSWPCVASGDGGNVGHFRATLGIMHLPQRLQMLAVASAHTLARHCRTLSPKMCRATRAWCGGWRARAGERASAVHR